jgi:hypothetical protein
VSPFISFFCRNLFSSHFATIPEYRRTPILHSGWSRGAGGPQRRKNTANAAARRTLKREVPLEIGPHACIENFNLFYILQSAG